MSVPDEMTEELASRAEPEVSAVFFEDCRTDNTIIRQKKKRSLNILSAADARRSSSVRVNTVRIYAMLKNVFCVVCRV